MLIFLRQLWMFVRVHRGRLFAGLAAGLIYALGSALLLLSVKLVFDAIFPTEGAQNLNGALARYPRFARDLLMNALSGIRNQKEASALIWVIAGVPFAMMLRGLGAYLSVYCMTWVATATIHDLRSRLFGHLQQLSLGFFGSARTGDLQSRLMNDTVAIQGCIGQGFAVIAREPATLLGILLFLVSVQTRLTLVALVVFPIVVVPIVIYGRKVRRSWKAAQAHTAELTDLMQESFTGMRVIKAFNLETVMTDRFICTSRRITSQLMRFLRRSELPGPMIETFGAAGVSLMLFYVVRLPASERPSVGDFTSFVGALFSLYQPVKNISRLWSQLQQGRAAGERLFPLLEIQPDIQEPAEPKPLNAQNAAIHFEKVSFAYEEKDVVCGFDLVIAPGSLVALVGASGSGKTTITNLLLRFQDPSQGKIRIGDRDLREVTTRTLRSQMAIVTQDTQLFNDTIRANIRMGRLDATDGEVETAARYANAHEFILARSGGYEANVGERGSGLSGGQRQRISIARALLRNAPILILDEATSALDSESERAVQTDLEVLMRGRTTLCIAHRLSTIQRANRIVVMDAGRIIEQGTHLELLTRGGHYARLYALQFGDA